MSIQFQQIPFTFSGGLNSKVDTFQLQAPQLLQADNVRFQLSGAISKRPGTVNLSNNILGDGQISNGVAVQSFNDELLAFDGNYIYSYIENSNAWVNRGVAISVINDQKKIINTRVAQQNNPDGTNLNGQELYVYEDTRGGVRYILMDSDTRAFIVYDKFVYELGTHPKTVAFAQQFNIYCCASYTTLFLNTINTNFPQALQPLQQVITDGYTATPNTYLAYDVCIYNNLPLIAYGGSGGLQVNYNGQTFVIDANATSVSCVSVCVVPTISGGGLIFDVIWITYATNSSTWTVAIDRNTFIPIFSPVNITNFLSNPVEAVNIATIAGIDIGSLNVTLEIAGATNQNSLINLIVNSNGVYNSQQYQLDMGLASKPFIYNNQIFVNGIFQTTQQATYYTLCLTNNFSAISKINPQVGGTYRSNGLLAECGLLGSSVDEFVFANQKKGAFQTNNNTSYSLLGVNASYIDFRNVNAFNAIIGANNLHIVGGIEKIYDGVSIVEDNFNNYAETADGYGCSVTFTSGGNLQTGQYQWVICYEWTDANNQVQRGQPSIPFTATANANEAAVLVIPTLKVTDKIDPRSPVSIAVFRNIIQAGIPSSIFYKVSDDLNPLVNNSAVETISFTDTTSDIQIAGNEPLYTSSQLYNSAPPACSLCSSYLTRIFLSGMEDQNIIWTSQDAFELDNYNTIPTEFSPLLVQGINSTGGAITAIAELSGTMIVFKEDIIYAFNGSGPNANGTSGGFTDAILITQDTGCSNPNSIIRIPANANNAGGLMYQSSNKGIYLLDINQLNSYIGAPVEQYNNYHITAAELLDANNEVIFTTLEGTVLVYNYIFNAWSTWSYLPAMDACIWQDQLVMIQSNGTVLVQQEDYYADYSSKNTDGYVPVVRTVQIPWLAFAGLQGYQSVRYAVLLGHYLSPHILNMSVLYNYNPSPKEPVSINSNLVANTFAGLPTWGAGPSFGYSPFTPYQFQYNFGYQFGQSISLIISDDPLSNNNQGGIWTGLTFEVGLIGDTMRLPAANKVGGTKTTQ